MLKISAVKLDLVLDIDVYQFIRGGVSYVALRDVEANDEYMKSYYKNESSVYIIYLDAKNLYGWAMNINLLTSKFKWLTQNEMKKLDVNLIRKDNTDGFLLELDFEYLQELQDLHNDYRLSP